MQFGAGNVRVSAKRHAIPFRQALRFWYQLGWLSFGGPAAQIALMERELVQRRRWIAPGRFRQALSFCTALPGPEAQQLAIYLGWLMHGVRGGLLAGCLFLLPGYFVLLGLSALFWRYGGQPWLQDLAWALHALAVALVWHALWRLGRRQLEGVRAWLIAVLAAFLLWLQVSMPLLVMLAALLGLLCAVNAGKQGSTPGQVAKAATETALEVRASIDEDTPAPALPNGYRGRVLAVCALLLLLGFLAAWTFDHPSGTLLAMSKLFLSGALITFGGAYAVLPYIFEQATRAHWLSPSQAATGIALGESTPGPLVMVVVFVAFLGAAQLEPVPGGLPSWALGLLASLLALGFTFVPSFLFVLLGAPWLERRREQPSWRAVLSWIYPVAVGAIAWLAWDMSAALAYPNRQIDWPAILLAGCCLALLVYRPTIWRPLLLAFAIGGFKLLVPD